MKRQVSVACLLLFFSVLAAPAALALAWQPLLSMPAPSAVSFSVKVDALPDGRLVAYDGDSIWVQNAVNVDGWTRIASGYLGDPGFVAVDPIGTRIAIGAGSGGFDFNTFSPAGPSYVWILNLSNPMDAADNTVNRILVPNNYDGAWLSATKLLIDSGPSYVSELGVVDFSATPPVYKAVMTDKGGTSCDFALDPAGQYVYVTWVAMWPDTSSLTKRVPVSAFLTAFETDTQVSWTSVPTGDVIGNFRGGGVGAVTRRGMLVYSGANPLLYVSPILRTVVTEENPSDDPFAYYSVGYNRANDSVYAYHAGGYLTDGTVGIPVAGPAALVISTLLLALAASRRLHRI